MATPKHRFLARLCNAAILCVAIPGHAYATRIPKAMQEADSEVQYFGWTGTAPDADALRTAIAQARVRAQVDGNYAGARQALEELWWKATSVEGFDGQDQVLIEVAVARAEVYRAQGRLGMALQAVTDLFLRSVDFHFYPEITSGSSGPIDQALRRMALEAAEDPRLVALRTELREATTAAAHTSLDEVVREAFAREDFELVLETGTPGQEVFIELILAGTEAFPERAHRDPLYFLIQMDSRQAARILLANLDAGGALWKRRILRAVDELGVLTREDLWSSEAPYLCLEPEWLDLLEALLSSPETAVQCTHLLSEPFLRDQLSPGIQAAVARGIANYGPMFISGVLQAIDHFGVVASARPLYHAIAEHGDAGAKRFAARCLAQFEADDVLRGMVDNPDPEIRTWTVSSLSLHSGLYIDRRIHGGTMGMRTTTRREYHQPTWSEADRALLARVADDPSSQVRKRLASGLSESHVALEDSVYLKLARDEDAEVRGSMAQVTHMSPDLRSEILTLLANDPSGDVRSAVDEALAQAPLSKDPTPYLGALRKRWTDTSGTGTLNLSLLADTLAASEEGVAFLLSVSRGPNGRIARDQLFLGLNLRGFGILNELDDASLSIAWGLAYSYVDTAWDHYFWKFFKHLQTGQRPRHAAMRAALRDTGLAPELRLYSAVLAAPDSDDAFVDELLALLQNEAWLSAPPSSTILEAFDDLFSGMAPEHRSAAALRIVQDATLPDAFAEAAVEYGGPLDRSLTLAVLQRWPDVEHGDVHAVKWALRHLAALPEDADSDLLARAARNPEYTAAAVEAIAALRRPELRSVLDQCIDAPWITPASERTKISRFIVEQLSSDLSEEAHGILFQHMQSASSVVRDLCAESLAEIEETRERQTRFSRFVEPAPTRESALEKLVEMLHGTDDDVRIEAIHAIGTFGAKEYQPTLIGLLKDPNEDVAAAARSALTRLRVAAD